jgi:hypothetical protein
MRPYIANKCLFIRGNGVILVIYIDNIIITALKKEDVDVAIKGIIKAFIVTDLGEVSYYLGMKISCDINGWSI